MPTTNTVIELQAIRYVRNGNCILDTVNWHIEAGSHWALLGANGSGKTSLLKIITGYEWPTEGEVRVMGETFGQCDLRTLRKTVGWVSTAIEQRLPTEDTSLVIALSGIDASIGLYRNYDVEENRRADAALHRIAADHLAERPFGLLSQGEQQRVLIARALINDPALLILDEPCAGLDPRAREELLDHLQQLALSPDAPTMIFVTHHLEEIGPFITHALLLRQGRVLASGPIGAAITDHTLSQTFDCGCRVQRRDNRFQLNLVVKPGATDRHPN